jgi:hypothetical protein
MYERRGCEGGLLICAEKDTKCRSTLRMQGFRDAGIPCNFGTIEMKEGC